jgi:small-conductance mechanosensitive channel
MNCLSVFITYITSTLLETLKPLKLLAAIAIFIIFFVIAKFTGKLLYDQLKKTLPVNVAKTIYNITYYTIITIGAVASLEVYGIRLSSLLVAGGFAGIVLGFASQNVFSNVFSGFFLYIDRPFMVGDPIEVESEGISGIVTDISMLSTKIQGWDGVVYRVPNSTLFTSNIKNLSKLVARRVEYVVSIGYGEDIAKAKNVIMRVLEEEPLALVEPPPQVFVEELGDSGVILKVRFWVPTSKWFEARTRVLEKIKTALDRAGIEIPFPQATIWFRTPLRCQINSEESKEKTNLN